MVCPTSENDLFDSKLPMQNLYLISINVTNKLKEKFFHEYVPDVLDVSPTNVTLSSPVHLKGSDIFHRDCKTSMKQELED